MIISVANSRLSRSWRAREIEWEDFVNKLRVPIISSESLADYRAMDKTKQNSLKDVGGFMGGRLKGLRRKNENVLTRSLVTLDLDNLGPDDPEKIIKILVEENWKFAVYSTRSHSPDEPRLRVIFPLEEEIEVDAYEPVARALAQMYGFMPGADPTTFEVARMMYWPSCSSDSEYVFEYGGDFLLKGEDVLKAYYDDWTDISEWPIIEGHEAKRLNKVRAEDPEAKTGIVGSFCRTYDIHEAIATFLPGVYGPCEGGDRYSYLKGSTVGGAVVYDGKFLYSYHATDPVSMRLVNAFDLVRLHKFGEKDDLAEPDTPVTDLPSYKAMQALIEDDERVQETRASEYLDSRQTASEVFDVAVMDRPDGEPDMDWLKELEFTGVGDLKNSVKNYVTILTYDPQLGSKIVFDEFSSKIVSRGQLPWKNSLETKDWTDMDDSHVRVYLESEYGLNVQKIKVADAINVVAYKNKFNDVKTYLQSLEWDGRARINTLLRDYLGAEENPYTADVMRKFLVAAVDRAVVGGTKWDYVPILFGGQGIGKSTFVHYLAKDWFSDTLTDFRGKDAMEMLRGNWILELGELTALNRSDSNSAKQFISRQVDNYRASYGRVTEEFPRRCVFIGTTNTAEFLRDVTGERRFWPVVCMVNEPNKSIFKDLEGEVDQIWAEAYQVWLDGEVLYIPGGTESGRILAEAHRTHTEIDARASLVEEYLNKPIPTNWYELSMGARKTFLQGNDTVGQACLMEREFISSIEIWCELFDKPVNTITKADSREINNIVESIDGWYLDTTKDREYIGGEYGRQRVRRRVVE